MRLRPNPGEVTRRSRQAVSQVDPDPPTNAKYPHDPSCRPGHRGDPRPPEQTGGTEIVKAIRLWAAGPTGIPKPPSLTQDAADVVATTVDQLTTTN